MNKQNLSMEPFVTHYLIKYMLKISDELPWNFTTTIIAVGHLTKFLSDPDNDGLILSIKHLNELAEEGVSLRDLMLYADPITWGNLESWTEPRKQKMMRMRESGVENTEYKDVEIGRMWEDLKARTEYNDQEMSRLFINCLIPDMRRFFNAPKLHQLSDEDKSLLQNEILAGFMDFLIQILNSEADFYSSYHKHSYALLQRRLTFLVTILGDTPFHCTELEDVKNLLVEFESLANEAGGFIYACVFASSQVMRKQNYDAGIQALLEKVETFLNEKIKEHCWKSSHLPKTTSSRSNPLDSLFIVDSLLEDLEGLINGPFVLTIDDIKDQIKILIGELTFFQTFLKDTEMLQVTHTIELEECLVQVRDVAYEAEYLINTHILEHTPSWYLNIRLPVAVQNIKLTGTRLKEIKEIYELKDIKIMNAFTKGEPLQVVRNLEDIAESIVIGFEDNKKTFLGYLTRGSKKLKVISISGMPGIGKTTAAKKLYKDSAVHHYFDLCLWSVVSHTYNKKKVLTEILRSLSSKSNEISDVEDDKLGLKIYQSLKGRRYFIIIDDVWDSSTWYDLKTYFPDDGNGSRILITSRIKDTAPIDSIFHELPLLSESQCCDLLVKKVFINEPCPKELLGIAKGIASKCYGLPLTVVVVAGILADSRNEESTWKMVKINLDSHIYDDQSNYALELSYEHLPNHLKPCFLDLGAYPEDEDIPLQKVIPMWITQGFVHKKEGKSLEHVAKEYLADLINRSLVMVLKKRSGGGIKSCSIHDLLRDMCIRKAEEEKFLKYITEYPSVYAKHSHLLMQTTLSETWSISALRSRCFSGYIPGPGYRVTQLPLLRVIDMFSQGYFSLEITRICSLVYLRYFSFPAPEIPNGICKLYNLEYLHLKTDSTISVPSTILNMVKLRHVRITDEAVFDKKCDSTQITSNLKSLSYVSITNHNDEETLKCLPHLRKLKCFCDGSFFPDLLSLNELESLNMGFRSPLKGDLAGINFPSTIKELSLSETGLPWDEMSTLGKLPNLRVLKLRHNAFDGKKWETRECEFQELRFLRLESIGLEQWTTSSRHFPELQFLVLDVIRGLLEIPSEFGDIQTLQTIEVCHCEYEVNRSAVQIEEEQRDYGNKELKIIIISNEWSKEKITRQLKEEYDSDASGPGEDLDSEVDEDDDNEVDEAEDEEDDDDG